MGWHTAVEGAIDALVLIAGQADELQGTTVRDGPAIESAAELQVLYIGWSGGDADTDAEAQLEADGLRGNPDSEQSVIRCTAWVLSGKTAVAPVRQRAYGIVSGLGAAIDRNRTLNKTVMRAMIGAHTLTQQQTPKGAMAAISFEVDLTAYTRR